jgi:hypothetical protein
MPMRRFHDALFGVILAGSFISSCGHDPQTGGGDASGAGGSSTGGCAAKTLDNCELAASDSGASAGACARGVSGQCAYLCNAGQWELVSNTCSAAGCLGATIDRCVLPAPPSGGGAGACADGLLGTCSYSCALGVWSMVQSACAPPVRCGEIEATRAGHETGFNYILDPFVLGGDTISAPTQSKVVVLENGKLLGPAHSLHADIRALGAGRFNQWGDSLYFSASDNSNPTTNGRTYTYGVPAGKSCPTRALQAVLLDTATTGYATFQSDCQKVVSNPYGYFLTYEHVEGTSATPGVWRLVQSKDQGRTFQTLIEDTTHATRAPALETHSGGMLYLASPDWLTNNSQVLIFNPNDHTEHLIPLPGVITYAKYAAAFDEPNHLLYYSATQSGHTLTIDTMTDAVTNIQLFTSGQHAEVHYPNLALGADGLLYYGWTTTKIGSSLYYSDHFVVNSNRGQTWAVPGGQTLTPPLIADDTGPSVLVTQPSDIGTSNWMDNLLPWKGKVHFVYTNTNGQRYVRYNMALPYGIDKRVDQIQGDTIKLGGLGNFFAADDQTGYLYLTGPVYASYNIATLISRDNGETWHDFAQSVISPGPVAYATGGFRKVTTDGGIIGSFTDNNNYNVYFIRVKAER